MKTLIMLISLLWFPLAHSPQSQYLFSGNSKVTIAGTSTLHDWTMDSKTVKGEADIQVLDDAILSIKDIKVEIPVESLKSGNGKMDNNAYAALKSEKHPKIYFQLKDFENINQNNGKNELVVPGKLTIAGTTKTVNIKVQYRTDSKGNLLVSGSKAIKMTDYGVTPPEVMFGTVKTGNDITINFDLFLAQQSNSF